jgi:cell division protein ZapA
MSETRMLLMAGLMLADRTAGLEEKVKDSDGKMAQLQAQIDMLEARPATRVEVPVVPTEVTDALAEVAARAESLADQIESGAGHD